LTPIVGMPKDYSKIFAEKRVEWEQVLIGALVFNPENFDLTEPFVDEADFYDPFLKAAYTTISDLSLRGQNNTSRIAARLHQYNEEPNDDDPSMPGFDVFEFLTSLAEKSAHADLIGAAQMVRQHANRERIKVVADWANEECYTGELSDRDFRDKLEHHLGLLYRPSTVARGLRKFSDGIEEWREGLGKENEDTTYTPTGLKKLDEALGGYGGGQLIVVGGRPGMGKTIFGTSAATACVKAGMDALIISQEMTGNELRPRVLCDLIRDEHAIKYSNVLYGKIDNTDTEFLSKAVDQFKTLHFHLDDRSKLSHGQISLVARKVKRLAEEGGRKLGLIVVDYLQLMRGDAGWQGNQNMMVQDNTQSLKALAMELDVPIMLISQLSRSLESRPDKRPLLSDLRDSGSIEQDANVVIFPYRDEYYLKKEYEKTRKTADKAVARDALDDAKNVCELIIAKSRNGATRTIKVDCDVTTSSFRDYNTLSFSKPFKEPDQGDML